MFVKGRVTYRFLYLLRHNDADKMTPRPHVAIRIIPRISAKSIVF